MKIGIDIHGVSDSNPFFKEMASAMVYAGHEVHIITGATSAKAIKDLAKLGMFLHVHYTHIFSITDKLIKDGVKVTWKDPDNPIFPDEEWDIAKSVYCSDNEITIHFDDSETYGIYFTTPYAMLKS